MKRSFASLGLALLAAAACTAAAFAGDTNVRQGEAAHSFTLPAHPMVSAPRPAPQPFIAAPQTLPSEHTVTATVIPEKNKKQPPVRTAAWLQSWQPNWANYCQRWMTGPQGEWLNPYCYVPLFGLLGGPWSQSMFAAPSVFAPSSPF